MPKASSSQTLARQWEILKLLPKQRPGITASEVVAKLEYSGIDVTKRTVERDLGELSRLFAIACNDKSIPYGWYWMQGEGINLPGLSITEALSLTVVEDQLKRLLPAPMLEALNARFIEARRKLDTLSKTNRHASWPGKIRSKAITLQLHPPRIAEGVLEAVQVALLQDKQLEVMYQSAGQAAKAMQLHPHSLIQGGSTPYLIATAWDYQDLRSYAVHRMTEANILDAPVKRIKNFDIDQYVSEDTFYFGNHEIIRLEAYLSKWLCSILRETPLSEDQVITHKENDEYPTLTATVENSWQLHWWILSQGEDIEILKPRSLRKDIITSLTDALAQYEDN